MKKVVLLIVICILMISCSRVQYISKQQKNVKKENIYVEKQFFGVWELYSVQKYGEREQKSSDFEIKLLYYLLPNKKMRFERYNFNDELELVLHGRWELDKKNHSLRMIFINGEKEEVDARYVQSLDENQMVLAKIPSEETRWVYKKIKSKKKSKDK